MPLRYHQRSAAPRGALHLRSDVERKRLFGVAETSRLFTESYRPDISTNVYARLNELAAAGLRAGRVVILDATLQQPTDRAAIAEVAAEAHVAFIGVWLDGRFDLLVRRVTERAGDACNATAAVVTVQAMEQTGAITWRRLDASQALAALKLAALELMPGKSAPMSASNPA